MKKAPNNLPAAGALGEQSALPLNHHSSAITVARHEFHGPGNLRQARVLCALMSGRRLTNNDVRSIGGALNGPHVIRELRGQGLCQDTELCLEWVEGQDRDARKVRYGEYFLTPRGMARVSAWKKIRG